MLFSSLAVIIVVVVVVVLAAVLQKTKNIHRVVCVCGPIYVTESRVACVSVSETTDLHPRKCNSRTHSQESKRKNLHLKVLCVCVVVSSRISPSCVLVPVRASLQQQQQQLKARAVLNSKYQKVSVISAIWQHFCLYFPFFFCCCLLSHLLHLSKCQFI